MNLLGQPVLSQNAQSNPNYTPECPFDEARGMTADHINIHVSNFHVSTSS